MEHEFNFEQAQQAYRRIEERFTRGFVTFAGASVLAVEAGAGLSQSLVIGTLASLWLDAKNEQHHQPSN